ncbi:MAG: PD-(D/E)XK nuclease family transposase [Lachnospiraceae bacterium]|nr:PD-(D/E)XK nuclease family transposase [Lachnospiraceae bacterium]
MKHEHNQISAPEMLCEEKMRTGAPYAAAGREKMSYADVTYDISYEELKRSASRETREAFEAIEAGRKLPELYFDRPFKKIFDADEHPERLETLFRLIFDREETVVSSLKNEMTKASIYSKQTVLDLLSSLKSGGIFELEMQVAAQEFLSQRIDVYSSDLILMQYSVNRGERRGEMDFDGIRKSYIVVLMKESPQKFRENPAFLHRRPSQTDTGIPMDSLIEVVYIELDKCLKQWKSGSCPKKYQTLALWLGTIADVNDEKVKAAADRVNDIASIREELAVMAKDRKELLTMLFDKYEKDVRYSLMQQAKRQGFAAGREEGREVGRREILKSQIAKKLERGFKPEEIADALEQNSEEVRNLIEEIKAESDIEVV